MDTATPPPSHRSEVRNRTKSASRLSRIRLLAEKNDLDIPNLSLEILESSPNKVLSPSPSSTMSPMPPYSAPLHELLLLSPSPLPKSKTRLAERLEVADDGAEINNGTRKRYKSRNLGMGASPRNNRRSRKRVDQDLREDRDFGAGEEIAKPRKKRQSGRSKKDKLGSVASSIPAKANDDERCNLERVGQVVNDLIMWKDVSKSSLWFGFGSICFLSSCFAKGIKFSIFSMVSQLGLLLLVVSFFINSVRMRENTSQSTRKLKLTEDDILKLSRLILPAANLAISSMAKLFSGEPAMTLKVAPLLVIGAEYGHWFTLWRLFALGFFFSFTVPRLYSVYSVQVGKKVDSLKSRTLETWEACSHKKLLAGSIVTAFWNLTSVRTRILSAFICLVLVKYHRQNSEGKVVKQVPAEQQEVAAETDQARQQQQNEKALVVVDP